MNNQIRERLDNLERVRDLSLPIHHHHYLVLHHLYKWMQEVAFPNVSGVMLDYGCGGRPYEKLFAPNITRYIAADVATAAETSVDVILQPNHPVPLPNASIDCIIANQTLEHVSDPVFYISECQRLLKPGGQLVLTAPMQWRHHETPYDYQRFTRYGIEHLINTHDMFVRDLRPCGGTYALLGQIWLNFLFRHKSKPHWMVSMINRTFAYLDRKYPDGDETINWMCLAQKNGNPPAPSQGQGQS